MKYTQHVARLRHARAATALWTLVAMGIVFGPTIVLGGPLKLPFHGHKRKNAAQRIPWNRLTAESTSKLRTVIDHPTIFREMPQERISCDPELFRFLVRYPEVVVNIWQLMGITKVSAQRTAPHAFSADDGAGTQTNVELLHADDSTHIMFCEGVYQGPLFKRVMRGRCVLVLRSQYDQDPTGAAIVDSQMDMFLQIDDLGLDVLARTLHPLLGKSTDRNFAESLKFVQRVCRTAEANGPGMQRLAMRMPNVEPQVRGQFAELNMAVHRRHVNRSLQQPIPQNAGRLTAATRQQLVPTSLDTSNRPTTGRPSTSR